MYRAIYIALFVFVLVCSSLCYLALLAAQHALVIVVWLQDKVYNLERPFRGIEPSQSRPLPQLVKSKAVYASEIDLVISSDCDDSSECSDVPELCEVVGGIEDVVQSNYSGSGSDSEPDNDLHQVTAQQTTPRQPAPSCPCAPSLEPRILTKRNRQSELIEVRSTVSAWKQYERERVNTDFGVQ
ncbi:hypothetical protein J6590_042875 [Homalodisca vitripennis]|nr:hypothetical protein J6590_042875 [Homalodisca vitripennis]